MKKKTVLIILTAVFLMLLGVSVFLISYFTSDRAISPITHSPRSDYQRVEIELTKTELTVLPAQKTSIELIGYRESEFLITESNGKLLLTDQITSGKAPIKLSGIGRFFKESNSTSTEKHVILYLSEDDFEKPMSVILQDSTLSLSASLDYLTLHAENSTVTANDFSFKRFDAVLNNCNSQLVFSYAEKLFSRDIETHNTKLSLNGDERANTELFLAENNAPSFVLEARDGSCNLIYPKADLTGE